VVQRTEASPRDDDDGQAQIAHPVAHVVTGREGDAPAADAFHGQMRETRAHGFNAFIQCDEIDGTIFGAGGEKRRGGFAEMDGIDFIERQGIAGCRAQEHGVLAVARGDRFQGGGGVALSLPGAHEPAGERGLADAGVGAGDEEAGHE